MRRAYYVGTYVRESLMNTYLATCHMARTQMMRPVASHEAQREREGLKISGCHVYGVYVELHLTSNCRRHMFYLI